jgi:hypothetical protein
MHRQGQASLTWYAIFADAAAGDAVEVACDGDPIERFNLAALLGRVGRRSIRAMWVIDNATNQVLLIHGAAPSAIAERYAAGVSKKLPAPSLGLVLGRRARGS